MSKRAVWEVVLHHSFVASAIAVATHRAFPTLSVKLGIVRSGAVMAAAVGGWCCFTMLPLAHRRAFRLPKRSDTGRPIVYLTFDDGPSEITMEVLDILEKFDSTASFFVLGENAELAPKLIERILAAGNSVEVHGFAHQNLALNYRWPITEIVDATIEAINRSGANSRTSFWFRPPYGFKSVTLLLTVQALGHSFVTWTLDSQDYVSTATADSIRSRVSNVVKPGDVILMHDGAKNRATVEALPGVLRDLKHRRFICRSLPSPNSAIKRMYV